MPSVVSPRALSAVLAVAASSVALAQPVQTPLPGTTIPKYVDALPVFAGQRVAGPLISTTMKETRQEVLPHAVYQRLPLPSAAGPRSGATR